MADLRVECPKCRTSFHTETLKIKTGHGDEALIHCLCNRVLQARFTQPEGRDWLFRKKPIQVDVQLHDLHAPTELG
jgi:hypothetical protein